MFAVHINTAITDNDSRRPSPSVISRVRVSGAAVVTPTHMKLPLNSSLLSSRTLGGTGKTTDLISLHFQTLEGGRSSRVGRQRVPDRRSNVSKRTSTEGFQVCLWNCEQSFCQITKGARWLILAERRRQVWRKSAVEVSLH